MLSDGHSFFIGCFPRLRWSINQSVYRPNREKLIWDGIYQLQKSSFIPSQLQKLTLGRYKTWVNSHQKRSNIPSQLGKTHLGRYPAPLYKKNSAKIYRPKRQNSNRDGMISNPSSITKQKGCHKTSLLKLYFNCELDSCVSVTAFAAFSASSRFCISRCRCFFS